MTGEKAWPWSVKLPLLFVGYFLFTTVLAVVLQAPRLLALLQFPVLPALLAMLYLADRGILFRDPPAAFPAILLALLALWAASGFFVGRRLDRRARRGRRAGS
jgi:hypothetical protein